MSPELLLSQPTSVTGAVAVASLLAGEDEEAGAEWAPVVELDDDAELPVELVVDWAPVDPGTPVVDVKAGVELPWQLLSSPATMLQSRARLRGETPPRFSALTRRAQSRPSSAT